MIAKKAVGRCEDIRGLRFALPDLCYPSGCGINFSTAVLLYSLLISYLPVESILMIAFRNRALRPAFLTV